MLEAKRICLEVQLVKILRDNNNLHYLEEQTQDNLLEEVYLDNLNNKT